MDNPTADSVDGIKARILVVDDEDFIREIICRKLTGSGFECDSAPSAEDALARIAQSDYDCVLSDIHMPGMSGVDLLRQIKVRNKLKIGYLVSWLIERFIQEHRENIASILKPKENRFMEK